MWFGFHCHLDVQFLLFCLFLCFSAIVPHHIFFFISSQITFNCICADHFSFVAVANQIVYGENWRIFTQPPAQSNDNKTSSNEVCNIFPKYYLMGHSLFICFVFVSNKIYIILHNFIVVEFKGVWLQYLYDICQAIFFHEFLHLIYDCFENFQRNRERKRSQ